MLEGNHQVVTLMYMKLDNKLGPRYDIDNHVVHIKYAKQFQDKHT